MLKKTAMNDITKTYGLYKNVALKARALSIGILLISQAHAATQHVVESGDTLSAIAIDYGVTETNLIDANGLEASYIRIGQVLTIPDKNQSHNLYLVKSGDSLSSLSKKYNIDINKLASANNLSTKSSLFIDSTLIIPIYKTSTSVRKKDPSGVSKNLDISEVRKELTVAKVSRNQTGPTKHRIEYGDTLSKIARVYQISISDLTKANNMALSDTLYFGQYLTIPTVKKDLGSTGNKTVQKKEVANSTTKQYVVRRGDTLMGVANKFDTDFRAIAKLSGISPYDFLAIGQTLTLPKNILVKATNNEDQY